MPQIIEKILFQLSDQFLNFDSQKIYSNAKSNSRGAASRGTQGPFPPEMEKLLKKNDGIFECSFVSTTFPKNI